jgi:hypothetical protein
MRRALSIAVHEPVRVLIFGAGASVPLMLSSWRCAFGLEALRHKERAHSWLPSRLGVCGFHATTTLDRSRGRASAPSCCRGHRGSAARADIRRLPVRISAFTDMPGNSAAGRPATLSEPRSSEMWTVSRRRSLNSTLSMPSAGRNVPCTAWLIGVASASRSTLSTVPLGSPYRVNG